MILSSLSGSTSPAFLSGVPEGAQALCVHSFLTDKDSLLYIAPTAEKAAQLAKNLVSVFPDRLIYHFPSWDCLPYDRSSPSQDILVRRSCVLTDLVKATSPVIVVTCVGGMGQKLPPLSAFQDKTLTLGAGGKIVHSDLITYFVQAGYQRVETVRAPGEFAVRGGIIDCFPPNSSNPVRLDFFGETLESLRSFDALSQKSLGPISDLCLYPAHDIVLTPTTISTFRSHFREKFGNTTSILYESISQGRFYAGLEHWFPLFYDQTALLTDYLPTPYKCIIETQAQEAWGHYLQNVQTYYQARLTKIPGDTTPFYYPLPPEDVYLVGGEMKQWISQQKCYELSPLTREEDSPFAKKNDFTFAVARAQNNLFPALKEKIDYFAKEGKTCVFACQTAGSQERLFNLCKEHGIFGRRQSSWPFECSPSTPIFMVYKSDSGFIKDPWVVISEQDCFGDSLTKPLKKQRKADDFFSQASQLSPGDFVVHQDHGIGRYEGLQVVTVEKTLHDCLTLIYEGDDKLFLPVENIELLSRYGNDSSCAQLDRLGAASWQLRKAKVKQRILAIADYLMKIAAQRILHQGETIIYPQQTYEDFCARFPYAETDDQLQATLDVLADLSSGHPMDRLICGDVGFGKTEVALRAAFAVAASGKQVAIIVPTTLLCRQHTLTFQERFKGFPIKVAQLSRFVTPKQAEETRQDLETGAVQVVIATHGIFADRIKFKDLGLVIIDEEQHFGVKQKEKLKQFKKDVHVLTLTATPIPRTLQLALAGVREMSLITTPPVDRLAVRTFLLPYDGVTIREAILREYYRGGQIFYVSPRLEDLPQLHEQIKGLVPDLKIGIAHGQLSAKNLEQVMIDFYERRFDLLLSTNIVESGIDISNANTLILHRSDLFGLSQLYQLRGRIGRSKTQGYAYLTLDPSKSLTANGQKRLEIMQTLDTLGAGFTLASHDMDIRGTGNIVGEEQSGHIREVGVELYQQLLQEAILSLRLKSEDGDEKQPNPQWTPQINLGVSVMIPETYVSDLTIRLGLYRRLSLLSTAEEINQFAVELVDRFGPLPKEAENLFAIIEVKALCRKAGIEKVDAGPHGVVISFKEEAKKSRNLEAVLEHIMKPTTRAKVRPDQKIVFMREWTSLSHRLKATKIICSNLEKLATSPKK